MTDCGGAVMVETRHMAVSVISQLSGQRITRGGRLDRLNFLDALGPVEEGMDMQ
jgi:hypothetical protein